MAVISADFYGIPGSGTGWNSSRGGGNGVGPFCHLLEAQTGTVIFEKDADRICSPASITKIMTLLLIFEALGQGRSI